MSPSRVPLPAGRLLAVLLLAAVVASTPACRRRATRASAPPPAPPAPNYLLLGDAAYAARDFAAATEAYRQFLEASPQAADRDRALFRVAMSYYARESPLHDQARALESLRQLAAALPASPYATVANLYLALHADIAAQQLTLAERSRRIEELSGELARLKLEDGEKAEELRKLKLEAARREERLRQVTGELERLKAIDMQRRPAAPRR